MSEEKPLDPKVLRFIQVYCRPRVRDVYRAAQMCKMGKSWGTRIWKKPGVQEEIQRRLAVVDAETAKVEAAQAVALDQIEEETLADNFLDRTLRKVIELDPKEHSGTVLRALQMGYVRKGLIKQGNTEAVVPQGQVIPPTAPGFYRSFERVVESSQVPAVAPAAPQHALPVPKEELPILDGEFSEEKVYSY